jgi:hypothetical protein
MVKKEKAVPKDKLNVPSKVYKELGKLIHSSNNALNFSQLVDEMIVNYDDSYLIGYRPPKYLKKCKWKAITISLTAKQWLVSQKKIELDDTNNVLSRDDYGHKMLKKLMYCFKRVRKQQVDEFWRKDLENYFNR